jgi:hypothetical protein
LEFGWDFGSEIGIEIWSFWNLNGNLEWDFVEEFLDCLNGSFGSRFFGWIDLDEDFWMDLDGSGFYGLDFVWMGGWMDFYYFGWIFYYFE